MPSASVLTINDGAATPVAHSFTPRGFVGPAFTTLVDLDNDIPAARPVLSLSMSPASSKRNTNRVKISFDYPKTATSLVDGTERLVYTARFNADVVIPNDMASADRADFAAFIKNALADSVVEGYIKELDPIW
jgi:hypothetical protein